MLEGLLFLLQSIQPSDTTLFEDDKSLTKRSWPHPNFLQKDLRINNPPRILTLPAKKVTRSFDSENFIWKITELPLISKKIIKNKEDTMNEQDVLFLENTVVGKQMEENPNLCGEVQSVSLKELEVDEEENQESSQTQDETKETKQLMDSLKTQGEENDLQKKDQTIVKDSQIPIGNETPQASLEEKSKMQMSKKIEFLKTLIFKAKEHDFLVRSTTQKNLLRKYSKSVRNKNNFDLTNNEIEKICNLVCRELADTSKSIFLFVLFLLFMNDKSKIFEVKNPNSQQSEVACKSESFKDTLEKINKSIQEWKRHKFDLSDGETAFSCLVLARNSFLQSINENSTEIEDMKYQLEVLQGLMVLLNKGSKVY
ncbi:hypothetical protein TUBRATIS_30960 [Tubulinosema ratisbonensis]|uniref:Uncharacterized protein n=1 Tax=Tubulinosema ratisbonensis TaxID=291195 RepID=A0A437AH56_9MICR|nr:hypothetical protein TUBRATIS_30960 [Tubulinosema ratisbonensis]